MRIIILMLIFAITGCGDKGSGNKAEAGAPPAQNTSLNSQFGSGPQAPEEKFAEIKRNAESGVAKDQLGLAKMYYNGDGVAKDDAKAAEWFQKAAEQGISFAQYKIGEMYDKGEGVPRDAAKAVEWWQKAAAQGNDAAQQSLKEASAKKP
ncbi:MAG: sel1 repeat family protein [Gallionella sp.]|nr:sel1 repeat family protein [Gallionella sp.]